MANDQSVVGRRRIYYNRHGDEDIAEMEGEKHEYPEGENHILRDAFPAQYYRWKNLEVHCNNDKSIRHPALSKSKSSKMPEISFNRLHLTDQECAGLQRRNFGCFVAREALLDEEYWTAAWLRAEAYWESLSYMREGVDLQELDLVLSSMLQLHKEFNALKRRCLGQDGNVLKCFCFVAVKKEEKNVRTVLSSVVGTLDLSIRQFIQGETYPGDVKRLSPVLASKGPFNANKYDYIANVCVAKFARRQGIASNMLYLAIDVANMTGIRHLFVHVNAENKTALDLYRKTGFKIFDTTSTPSSNDERLLMSMEL